MYSVAHDRPDSTGPTVQRHRKLYTARLPVWIFYKPIPSYQPVALLAVVLVILALRLPLYSAPSHCDLTLTSIPA